MTIKFCVWYYFCIHVSDNTNYYVGHENKNFLVFVMSAINDIMFCV